MAVEARDLWHVLFLSFLQDSRGLVKNIGHIDQGCQLLCRGLMT
jgi:hypothetical protein